MKVTLEPEELVALEDERVVVVAAVFTVTAAGLEVEVKKSVLPA